MTYSGDTVTISHSHSLFTDLHFGLDLSAGEVATVPTGMARVRTHDLSDGLWEGRGT